MKSIQAKIVLLGSQGVGKTSLVTKYVTKTTTTEIAPTIGATFFNCRITLDDIRVQMQVWDTAGQERFRSMAPMYYRGANAALLVFDLTNYTSFVDIKTWVSELQRSVVDQMCVLTLVGNKCDLPDRVVSKEEATLYANSIGGYYFETSFTNQGSIEKVFTQTALGLVHLSSESNSGLKRYESIDSFPTVTAVDQSLLMTNGGISLGVETALDEATAGPFESGREENVAFSIDHIAHGDEHRAGCCW